MYDQVSSPSLQGANELSLRHDLRTLSRPRRSLAACSAALSPGHRRTSLTRPVVRLGATPLSHPRSSRRLSLPDSKSGIGQAAVATGCLPADRPSHRAPLRGLEGNPLPSRALPHARSTMDSQHFPRRGLSRRSAASAPPGSPPPRNTTTNARLSAAHGGLRAPAGPRL